MDRQAGTLYGLIPELIFGEGNGTLGQAVGRLLKERGQTLALAESCTGGYLSHLITAVPGSSAYYIGGVVSYANAVKMEELGIPSDMLELNGAVSQPVALHALWLSLWMGARPISLLAPYGSLWPVPMGCPPSLAIFPAAVSW